MFITYAEISMKKYQNLCQQQDLVMQRKKLSYLLSFSTSIIILFRRMDQRLKSNHHHSTPRKNKYDDWMCLFCQNHNYSFRKICNRCHFQTKQQNTYMNLIYQQQIQIEAEQKSQSSADQSPSLESLQVFPNVVFLMVTDDPWEQYPQIRQTPKPLNVMWINNLIQQ